MAFDSISRVGSSAMAQRISRQTHHHDRHRAEPPADLNSEPRSDTEKHEAEESNFSVMDPVVEAILAQVNSACCQQVAKAVKKLLRK